MKAKLERSRQSARECRARKKIRYQYLDELVADREKAVLQLRKELEYTQWARSLDEGHIPEAALKMVEEEKRKERERLADRDTNRQSLISLRGNPEKIGTFGDEEATGMP
ncbi:unnamed protein product [Larinioides sclopetarius]|uniref:cAMP-responsive element-binding protein-like 2 n=1 Tax=Larinioides sclopetarius TaxID=280406 RepID=A0AAV2BC43_9ARAC